MPDDADDVTDDDTADALAVAVGEALQRRSRTVAVAESLTGGLLSNALARAEGSSEWFRGGVVAYASQVKHDLLAVRPGPVVSSEAAADMAEETARLLGADVAVSVTGAAGPDGQDGQPPGTVWLAVTTGGATHTQCRHFDGDPPEVCRRSVVAALRRLLAALDDTGGA